MHEHQPHDNNALEIDLGNENGAALARAIGNSPPVDAPRIWVGGIEDYLDNAPHGRWISAARHPDALAGDVNTMLRRSPAAKRTSTPSHWGIFASQGFGRHDPPPEASLGDVARRAQAIRRESRAFAAWAGLNDGDQSHALRFNRAYQGQFDNFTDWLVIQVEKAGWDRQLDALVPAAIRPFIDVNLEAIGHDMLAGGEVAVVPDRSAGGVWIFDTREQRQHSDQATLVPE